ncbi:NUDIX hydrolase [Lactobacillus sp. CC-MHH1034]|uniref:NUDIX hydrolase n=1 Tax=Agrilactobacillus fermenti TaxID=2586909 RepID=UPI001E6291C2|nr:NUDIX hydrolase [Agrilactobacillus fermenti]MCD2255164.1 NUDIX hydrolase [Agrilactobacillus fermenti]
MADYIHDIRAKVGHMPIILNAVAGIILNDQGQILLQKRTDTHNWSVPGGYMEYGESFIDTLHREVLEDSGLEVKPIKLIHVFDQGFTKYPNGDITQAISVNYLVKPIGGTLIAEPTNETLAMAYFDLDDLPPLLNQQNADIMAYVRTHLTELQALLKTAEI